MRKYASRLHYSNSFLSSALLASLLAILFPLLVSKCFNLIYLNVIFFPIHLCCTFAPPACSGVTFLKTWYVVYCSQPPHFYFKRLAQWLSQLRAATMQGDGPAMMDNKAVTGILAVYLFRRWLITEVWCKLTQCTFCFITDSFTHSYNSGRYKLPIIHITFNNCFLLPSL